MDKASPLHANREGRRLLVQRKILKFSQFGRWNQSIKNKQFSRLTMTIIDVFPRKDRLEVSTPALPQDFFLYLCRILNAKQASTSFFCIYPDVCRLHRQWSRWRRPYVQYRCGSSTRKACNKLERNQYKKKQVALIEAIHLAFECYFMYSEVYRKYDIRIFTFQVVVLR